MRVLAKAARRAETGAPVFNLTAGQPSTPAPEPVLAAAKDALDRHILGYTESPGIPELRRAIAGHYRTRYHLDVHPESVFVTTGSSGGFVLAFLAAFDAGSRVGLPRPGYPAYRNMLQALGCTVVDLPCGPDSRFQPTVEMVLDADLDALVVASPANPTGTMLPASALAELASVCASRGIRLVSDEIYHGISYTADEPSSSWATDRTGFVVNSFSKYFSMTGWRIGWLLVPEDLVDAVDALAGNFAICPPAPAQYAAVAAFAGYDECDGHVARYAVNRDLLLDGLRELGITRLAPADGAFYVYADVDRRFRSVLRSAVVRHRGGYRARHRLRPDRRPPVPADVVRRQHGNDPRRTGRAGRLSALSARGRDDAEPAGSPFVVGLCSDRDPGHPRAEFRVQT
jgi:aspartate/methionine/tyrosine aminotransferase